MSYILITRPNPQAQSTAKIWKERGHDCLISPVIERAPIENYQAQLNQLNENNAGFIITSGYALNLLAACENALAKPLYLTGNNLANLANKLGFRQIFHGNSSAESLIAYLRENIAKTTGLMCLSSNHQAVDIAGILQNQGFNVQNFVIYNTISAKTLSTQAIAAIKARQIEAVLFYSTMSARSFIQLAHNSNLTSDLVHMQAICISENVAGAIEHNLFAKVKIDPKTLLDLP